MTSRKDSFDESEARKVELCDRFATVERRKVKVDLSVVLGDVKCIQIYGFTKTKTSKNYLIFFASLNQYGKKKETRKTDCS